MFKNFFLPGLFSLSTSSTQFIPQTVTTQCEADSDCDSDSDCEVDSDCDVDCDVDSDDDCDADSDVDLKNFLVATISLGNFLTSLESENRIEKSFFWPIGELFLQTTQASDVIIWRWINFNFNIEHKILYFRAKIWYFWVRIQSDYENSRRV